MGTLMKERQYRCRRVARLRLRKQQQEQLMPTIQAGCTAPYYVAEIEPWEREERCVLSAGKCIIDNEYYYVRGRLTAPNGNGRGNVHWDVWIQVSGQQYDALLTTCSLQEQTLAGKLSSAIPGYPDTLALPVTIKWQPRKSVLDVHVDNSDHLLAIEQRQGLSFQRWLELQPLHNAYHKLPDAR
ncbi:DUF2199 domain-containing protein [Paenibacillus sp. 481]|uniref:DUF2199 domain-containing protein n=1 Tax=Paenibacillus sp. 481 TaxID=2835869 RepID=UPI001E34053E|nr:DUF2199 domain-containing protein [Paenibacillus sp. 481]